MKIVLAGSLGNIGQPLAEELVQRGHAVTVISRQPAKQPTIAALGASAAIGSLADADFLAATLAGADAVFALVPPDFGAPDQVAYYRRIGRSYAQAIARAGVPRVVHLSSYGAHLAQGTGFIVGSHVVEGLLNELPDVALTHLRPGYFYTNLYGFVDMIKGQGIMGSNYGGDDKLVMVHPRDVAAAAAEELTSPTPSPPVRYVASDELTATEAARILGAAIGLPELPWLTFTDEQTQRALEQRGLPAHLVTNFVALDLLDLTREIEINLAGPIRMVQQFLPHLKAQKTAAILNVTSGLALTPYPVAPVYGATKAGLRSYTQSLRVQLHGTRVKVFELVAPAAKTPLTDQFAADLKESDLMDPGQLIGQAIQAMQRDTWEVYPGMATALRYLSRLAPGFMLKQLSKGVAAAIAPPQGQTGLI